MKRGILLYTAFEADRNRFFISRLISSAQACGISLSLCICDSIAYDNTENIDFAVNRTNNAHLADILSKKGIRVFNSPFVSLIANSKYRSCLFASKLGIPVMPTEIFDADERPVCSLPAVIKPDNGKGGKNVFLVNSLDQLYSSAFTIGAPFVVQKPSSDLGRDTRVYMLGTTPIAAMTRVSDTDFRSNFCLGGRAQVHTLSDEEREYAVAIASALGSDYVGIDFIYDGGRPVFNEIEDAVGARMLYTYTDIDIADMYIRYIANLLETKNDI